MAPEISKTSKQEQPLRSNEASESVPQSSRQSQNNVQVQSQGSSESDTLNMLKVQALGDFNDKQEKVEESARQIKDELKCARKEEQRGLMEGTRGGRNWERRLQWEVDAPRREAEEKRHRVQRNYHDMHETQMRVAQETLEGIERQTARLDAIRLAVKEEAERRKQGEAAENRTKEEEVKRQETQDKANEVNRRIQVLQIETEMEKKEEAEGSKQKGMRSGTQIEKEEANKSNGEEKAKKNKGKKSKGKQVEKNEAVGINGEERKKK